MNCFYTSYTYNNCLFIQQTQSSYFWKRRVAALCPIQIHRYIQIFSW